MATRSWRWLRTRITGLVSRPGTYVVLGHDRQHYPVTEPVYPNRLQAALMK